MSASTGRPAAVPAARPARLPFGRPSFGGLSFGALPFRRAKWDKQPTQPSAVLIATTGIAVPPAVIRQAVSLSGGRPVAVVSIARMYGSSLGLPNAGLLPSKSEIDGQRALVAEATRRLERSGVQAWGQVAVSRRYAKTIVTAARARGVDHVLVITPEVPRWRRLIEGDLARDVKRRARGNVEVEGITL